MKGSIPMTPEGFKKLKEQLRKLEQEEWPQIIKEIEIARGYGDLSENAEYQYAKEKQGQIDAKIRQLKDKLARAEVIDVSQLSGDTIAFGATVHVKNLDSDSETKYTLVGPEEADFKNSKISITSPIGKAFIGKKKGEIVEVTTPGGVRSFEILKITWGEK